MAATAAAATKTTATTTTTTRRGALIVVEGLDRAGKSVQVARLTKQLGARLIKFPERTTPIGRMIDAYLMQKAEMDDRAIHLLFSANRWETSQSILSTLESGQDVVCDRYAFSGIAYSCAKGLSYEWCKAPDVGLPLPDITLFLALSPQAAAKRGGYGEERYETVQMQQNVRACFSRLCADPAVGMWKTIDADQSIEAVAQQCLSHAQQTIDDIAQDARQVGSLFQ